GSWIGGDRDGNPFVTNEVTHQTVCDNRVASLRRYRQRLAELLQALSPTERAAPISVVFRQALSGQLEQSGAGDEIVARNPGEVFRQYVACLLRRLDATLSCAEQGNSAPAARGYRTADDLIADLKSLEAGLADACARGAAELLVRPVRREVEAFRFSTFRLDLRENSARLDAALTALWRVRNQGDPPAPRSVAWRGWLQGELAQPLRSDRPTSLPAEAAETLGMFRLTRELRDQCELGAREDAGQAHAAGAGVRRRDHVLPRPRRVREPRRRAHGSRDRGATRRLDPGAFADHGAGGGRLVQVRQSGHRGLPGGAPRRQRAGALGQVRARGGAGANGGIRQGDGGP